MTGSAKPGMLIPGFRCAQSRLRSFPLRPHRTGHAVKRPIDKLGDQKPRRIDRAGHDGAPRRHALEAGFTVIRLVADQHDELVALRGRFLERTLDQGLTDAALAERRLDGQRAEQERLGVADANGRQPHRTDQQRAGARRERHVEPMCHLLAQAVGGFGVAAGPKRALVEAVDRRRVGGGLGQDGERQIVHRAAPSISTVRGPAGARPSLQCPALSPAGGMIKLGFASAEIIVGLLVDGVWQEDVTRTTNGRFVRPNTAYHNFVTPDGSPGPNGKGGFPAEAGRYHLYISLASPWAHRTLIFRSLKQLDNVISVSLADPLYGKTGWEFGGGRGGTPDSVNGKKTLAEVYLLADPHYTGRVSVPVLWDKKQRTIVNNESSEIIRMLNSAFEAFTNVHTDYYPAELRGEIDRINDLVYPTVNNGVYRAGFATSQDAYEEAARGIFATFDQLEERLSRQRYLAGKAITEADWRLFTTLIRFDAVYYSHFKCNLRRVADYPNLSNYLRDLYQVPGIAETVSIEQIKRHYYGSQRQVNPTGIVPIGPTLDFTLPHDRARFA